jgi:hypothetical protein
MPRTTPLGAIVSGLLAGAAGTLARDALLYRRYRTTLAKDLGAHLVYGTATAAAFAPTSKGKA